MLMHINFNAVILFNLILYHSICTLFSVLIASNTLAIRTENSVHILEAEINNDKFKHFQ